MLEQPTFPMLVKKFLYRQLYPNSELSFMEALEASCLEIDGKIRIFNSAIATFHAPSVKVYQACTRVRYWAKVLTKGSRLEH